MDQNPRSTTKQKTEASAGKIILINDTDSAQNSNTFEKKKGNGTTVCSCFLKPHEVEDVTDKAGWTLRIREEGLKLLCDGEVVPPDSNNEQEYYRAYPAIVLEMGKEYRIAVDESCPPLTEEEGKKAFQLIVACAENGCQIPKKQGRSSLMDLALRSVLKEKPDISALSIPEELKSNLKEKEEETSLTPWQWVLSQIGRPKEAEPKIRKMLDHFSCTHLRTRWKDLYYARRPQVLSLNNNKDNTLLLSALEKMSVGVVVYFRAMDRFPGGNADIKNMKFKFFLPRKDSGCDDVICTWCVYNNWDGDSEMYERSEERWRKPTKEIQEKLLDPIKKVLKEGGDLNDVETHIIDPQCDSDEYDTEWSSIEILVYLPPSEISSEEQISAAAEIGRESFPPPPTGDPSTYEKYIPSPTAPIKKRWGGATKKEEGGKGGWVPPLNAGPAYDWPLVYRFHQRALLTEWQEEDQEVEQNLTEGVYQELVENVSELLGMGRVESTLEDLNIQAHTVESIEFDSLGISYACPVFIAN